MGLLGCLVCEKIRLLVDLIVGVVGLVGECLVMGCGLWVGCWLCWWLCGPGLDE